MSIPSFLVLRLLLDARPGLTSPIYKGGFTIVWWQGEADHWEAWRDRLQSGLIHLFPGPNRLATE